MHNHAVVGASRKPSVCATPILRGTQGGHSAVFFTVLRSIAGDRRTNAGSCMLEDTSASRQLGLVSKDLLLRTTGLSACSFTRRSDLTSLENRSSFVTLSAQPSERSSGLKNRQ